MRLSDHFTASEFRSHDGADLPARCVPRLRVLCTEYLEPLRRNFGPVLIVSGVRSSQHNRNVGGAPQSYHLCLPRRGGAAADIRCREGSPKLWHRFLDELGAPGLGLYTSWVHVDTRHGRARW